MTTRETMPAGVSLFKRVNNHGAGGREIAAVDFADEMVCRDPEPSAVIQQGREGVPGFFQLREKAELDRVEDLDFFKSAIPERHGEVPLREIREVARHEIGVVPSQYSRLQSRHVRGLDE